MSRLIVACLLLLCSLLCVFRAPQFHLWYLAIIVTEYPLVTCGITVLTLLAGIVTHKHGLACTVFCTIALLLFLVPVFTAMIIGRSLEEKLDIAFGAVPGAGIQSKEVPSRLSALAEKLPAVNIPFEVIPYSDVSGQQLTLDFYRSQKAGLRPCVIVVHGGSWSGGDSRQMPELNSVLAQEGYNVVSINYRLAPAFTSPAQVTDVHSAINYLRKNAEALGIDTNNFVLIGRSAGAQIALIAAYDGTTAGIKGAINIYGPADMIWGYKHPNSPLVMNSCKVIEDYFGGTYDEQTAIYRAGSPIELVRDGSVPTLSIHGMNDPLVAFEHSTRLECKLQEHHVPHFLLVLPWATHACDYTLNGPSGQLVSFSVVRFLQIVTGRARLK